MESTELRGRKREALEEKQEGGNKRHRSGEEEARGEGEQRDVGSRHSDVIKVAELRGCTLSPFPGLHIWKVYEFMNTV